MAVDTTGQSVAKAAGDTVARGRSRGTGKRRSTRKRSFATHWYAWAMVAPVVVVIGVIIGYPLVRGIYLSFTDANERNVARSIGVNQIPATYEFVGVDNYVDALTGSQFLGTLVWTVIWTVACVSITFALGLGLANLLNRRIAGRSVYRMLLILPGPSRASSPSSPGASSSTSAAACSTRSWRAAGYPPCPGSTTRRWRSSRSSPSTSGSASPS